MITVRAHPSLALIKYWGKSDTDKNYAATSSLAINLKELYTETRVSFAEGEDSVWVDEMIMPKTRYAPFFESLRRILDVNAYFLVKSYSNFPKSAGLASSSSGFAALAYGAAKLVNNETPLSLISEIARLGSASAARAVFEGFTLLKKNTPHAEELFDALYWPELRVIIAIVKAEPKDTSSRLAMELSKNTSPCYASWLEGSDKIFGEALLACKNRDLDELGPLVRKSYLMMFSTMFTSSPPLLYWEPESLGLIKACEKLRAKGHSIWETMDAGPQVKMICLSHESEELMRHLEEEFPHLDFLLSEVGGGPVII